ncbi:MAG: lipoprotein-releasing system ATP-binding protein LolD [Nitrospinaceae bacterium]|nr:MAG: lipoprotein-releasing system ATP-binding protein LolD [Nitrospinaceae bacterium]
MNSEGKPNSPDMPLLEGVDVNKSYKTRRETLHILVDAGLKVLKGEVLGIVGASGVGKSTLLHVLGGLDRPDSGRILFRGVDIYRQKNNFLDKFRNRRVGFVFQFFNLLPDFTALENAMFPAIIRNESRKVAQEKAEHLLCQVGLKERLLHKPGELSGGESQRVALARALINQPDLLLADEPTGNLDTHASDSLIELIRKLNEEFKQTFVLVTHSQRIAQQMDRVMQLSEGKVKAIDRNVII